MFYSLMACIILQVWNFQRIWKKFPGKTVIWYKLQGKYECPAAFGVYSLSIHSYFIYIELLLCISIVPVDKFDIFVFDMTKSTKSLSSLLHHNMI